MTDFPRSLLEFQQRFPDSLRRDQLAGRLRLSGLRQPPGVGARDQGIHP